MGNALGGTFETYDCFFVGKMWSLLKHLRLKFFKAISFLFQFTKSLSIIKGLNVFPLQLGPSHVQTKDSKHLYESLAACLEYLEKQVITLVLKSHHLF